MGVLVISYSRVDRSLARGLVAFLRAGLIGIDATVFWDEDLVLGGRWLEEIKQQIDAAQTVFVLWCAHSARSQPVAQEFRVAIAANKRVIPVLLDDTPLAEELAPIQGIDLRHVIAHNELSQAPSRFDSVGKVLGGAFGLGFNPAVVEAVTERLRQSGADALPLFSRHLEGTSVKPSL